MVQQENKKLKWQKKIKENTENGSECKNYTNYYKSR